MGKGSSGGELLEWERERILRVLKENDLDLAKTAAALGYSRSTLWRKMKKYDIESK
jgi:transcriptional regulator of acetoin/glycerol metabolism